MSFFAGDLILELVEMFLKAATDVSSYSQQPSPRSFVYVRTRITTAEHRVSEAAWAVQGILNICLKNKRFTTSSVLLPGAFTVSLHKINKQLDSPSRSDIFVNLQHLYVCCCTKQCLLRMQRMYLRGP
jgi:hypothetical protein